MYQLLIYLYGATPWYMFIAHLYNPQVYTNGLHVFSELFMKLKFYGMRGSAPVCDTGFQEFGGNTTCVRIAFPDTQTIAIIDTGTKIRNLSKDLLAMGHRQEQITIAFSHFHWDHIQNFPFFAPAYDVSQNIVIHALGQGRTIRSLREIFEVQMQAQYFPRTAPTHQGRPVHHAGCPYLPLIYRGSPDARSARRGRVDLRRPP